MAWFRDRVRTDKGAAQAPQRRHASFSSQPSGQSLKPTHNILPVKYPG